MQQEERRRENEREQMWRGAKELREWKREQRRQQDIEMERQLEELREESRRMLQSMPVGHIHV